MSVRVDPGTLLLSAPELQDPNFMHTMVLMVEHAEEGAFGLVVNRPLDARVRDAFPTHPILGDVDLRLRAGGPVALDTLQVVHRLPAESEHGPPRGREVTPGVFVGGDVDVIARLVEHPAGMDEQVRFVVGYSGWGAGQLEREVEESSWIPLPATPDLVFATDAPEVVWRRALRRLDGEGASLADLPPDPSWN